tara:strand:+ start:162 stop:1289 length:1128 start_codon:yes stop_codon:yes gene_type:complete
MANRTLRRPMFRMGGSTGEGITSGLTAPRQNYQDGKTVEEKYKSPLGLKFTEMDINKLKDLDLSKVDIRNANLQQLKDLASQMSYQPRGTNINDFLISAGLNLVSNPSQGNIFQDVAASSKDPYKQFMAAKQSAAEQKYASESDMFKTLIAAKADMAGGASGKTYAKLEIAADIERTMADILNFETRIKAGEKNLIDKLNQKRARLDYLSKENSIGKSLMQNTEFAEDVLKGIVNTLNKELITTTSGKKKLKYTGKSDPELLREAYRQYAKFFENVPDVDRTEEADGGRIGYQAGMSVQPAGMPMGQAPMTTDQEPKIDYETLRARLPQEITDDIVRLIAASPQALEDFATIATQQDVDQFNKTYSVNLVLPAEA